MIFKGLVPKKSQYHGSAMRPVPTKPLASSPCVDGTDVPESGKFLKLSEVDRWRVHVQVHSGSKIYGHFAEKIGSYQ